MQPRGFFRPKFKTAAKNVVAKATRPTAAIAKSGVDGEQKAITAPSQEAARSAALPAGSVVRHRHKPDPKTLANGSTPGSSVPGTPSKKQSDALRVAVAAAGPALPPAAAPSLPPELLQSMERSRTAPPQTRRAPANGHTVPVAPQFRAVEPAAAAQRQPIVAPLSDALARATGSNPTAGRPAGLHAPANGVSPVPPSEPQPRLKETPPPPPPPVSALPAQPDFSTLPPSIAASLARLAGNGPLQGDSDTGETSANEQKIASKG